MPEICGDPRVLSVAVLTLGSQCSEVCILMTGNALGAEPIEQEPRGWVVTGLARDFVVCTREYDVAKIV